MLHLQYCEEKGGYLAEIKSQSEQSNIETILERPYSYWIGMTDLANEGQFVWQQTSTTVLGGYTNWSSGEPNNGKARKETGQDCGQLWEQRNWSWDDLDCDYKSNNQMSRVDRGKKCKHEF